MPLIAGIIVGFLAGPFVALALNPRGYLAWLLVAALIVLVGIWIFGASKVVLAGMVVGAIIGFCGKGL